MVPNLVRTNKTNKSLTKCTKKKSEREKKSPISGMRGDITTDPTDVKK